MKIPTAFLVAVTVLTRFQESFTLPGSFFTSTKSGISSLVDKSKTGIGSLVSNVGENIASLTKVEIAEAEKQEVLKNIDKSEDALASAKKIIADALLNATGMNKVSITAAGLWMDAIQTICDILHPQNMRDAIANSSVLDLNTVVIKLSAAIEANKLILAKFDDHFPDKKVKTDVSREIKTILHYAIYDLDKIKKWLSN